MIATYLVTDMSSGMPESPEKLVSKEMRERMRPEQIGRRLLILRLSERLKPSEMSDRLGIERTYWSRWEKGKRPPTDHVRALLIQHFDITMDWLILGRWDKLPYDRAEKMREAEAHLDSGFDPEDFIS